MAHQNKHEHVYSYVLQGSPNLFVDERDKKQFLDLALGIELREQFKIYAFCITDDAVCFLLGGTGKAMINAGIRKVIAEFSARRIRVKQTARSERALVVTEKKLLPDEAAVKVCCREIHRLPADMGYVTNIRDYWWSSYRTYLGYYNWNLVDCSVILQMFASDRETAVRQFRRFHEAPSV